MNTTTTYKLALTLAFSLCSNLSFGAYSTKQLKKMESQVQAAVKRAIPATVSVHPLNFSGAGSGVIVSKDGYVLTAAHVVTGSKRADLVFPDGKQVEADVLSRNPRRDIALLKITEPGEYPYVEIGDSKTLQVTDILIALGHPGGYDIRRSAPIRIGRVYTPGHRGFIVTDCTLIGGDSGGPLISLDGKVVGIHSSIGGTLSNNNHAPVHAATDHWEKMKAGRDVGMPMTAQQTDPNQPVLGIVLENTDGAGVPVTRIVENSPASKADIAVGDRIIEFDGKEVLAYTEFFDMLNDKRVGDKITLTLDRHGEEVETSVTLARRGDIYGQTLPKRQMPEAPEPQPANGPAFLGIYFDEASSRPVIAETVADSGAHAAGLIAGDRILSANGKSIRNIGDLKAILGLAKIGDQLDLAVSRAGKKKVFTVTLGAYPDELR